MEVNNNPDFIKQMQSAVSAGMQQVENVSKDAALKNSNVTMFNPDSINQYRFQDDFNATTFNPFDTEANYDRWVAKETWGTALEKGFDGFATRFGNTFVDYWKDYGRMADALINWDMSKMMPSEMEMYEQHYKDQQEGFKNKVFVPHQDQDDIFGKAGISEFVSNAGFAMGTYAAFATELLVDAAITAATASAGAGSFAATMGKFGAKIGIKEGVKVGVKKGLSFVDDIFRGFSKVENIDDIARITTKSAAEVDDVARASKAIFDVPTFKSSIKEGFEILTLNTTNILKSKSAGEFFLNVAKGVPVVGSGVRHAERIVKAGKAGYSGATMIGIGARGIHRMANEINMSSTEAAFEAISAYGETLDLMLKDYNFTNGQGPTGLEFASMQHNAMKAATANYQTNMAVLLASNKIQFGTLFNKFPMQKTFVGRMFKEANEEILTVVAKGAQKPYEIGGIGGGIKTVFKIGKDFGVKKASWEAAKLFKKDFLKFEVVEGVQEILQETSNIAWKNYYSSQFADGEKTLADAFGEGLGSQWSKQGLKVFVHGALTGSIIRIPTKVIGAGLEQAQLYSSDRQYGGKENNPMRQQKAQQTADVETVTKATWNADYKKSPASQLITTIKASINMNEAVQNNDEKAWNDAKDNLAIEAALAANRLGIDDAYVSAIEHMADDMTVEDFNKVFGVDLSQTKYKTPQEYAKSVAKDIEIYSKTLTETRKQFDNLIDPRQYNPNSYGHYAAAIARNKQEEAIQNIALMQIKGNRNIERVKKLKEEIGKISGLESSSQYGFNVLTSMDGMASEMGQIKSQMLTIQESLKLGGLTAEEKANYNKQLALLTEREEDLNKWATFFIRDEKGNEVFIGETFKDPNTNEVINHDPNSKAVKDLFRKIMNNKNKEEGLPEISEKAFQESAVSFTDMIRLTEEAKSYMDSYTALYNPERFTALVERMVEGQLKFHITNAIEHAITVVDGNILRHLVKKHNLEALGFEINTENKKYIDFLLDLFKSNPKIKEDYDTLRKSLFEQLDANTAYRELINIITNTDKSAQDIEKVQQLALEVGKVIEAFDASVLISTDEKFANTPLTPDQLNIEKPDSTSIAKIAAKLENGNTLTDAEKEFSENEKIKPLIEEARANIKKITIENKEDASTNTEEDLNALEIPIDQVEENLDKEKEESVEQVISNTQEQQRDAQILKNRERLGLSGDISLNLSEEVYDIFDDLDNKIAVTNDRLQTAVDQLYRAYKKMYASMKSDSRTNTIEELQNMADYLEKELETLTQIIYEQEKEGKFIHEIKTDTIAKKEQGENNTEEQSRSISEINTPTQLALPLPRKVIDENNKTEKVSKTEEKQIIAEIDNEIKVTGTKIIEVIIEDSVEEVLDKLDNSIPVLNEDIRNAIEKLYDEYKRLNRIWHADFSVNREHLAEMIFLLEKELDRLHFILNYQTSLGKFHKEPTGRRSASSNKIIQQEEAKIFEKTNKNKKVKKEKETSLLELFPAKSIEESNYEYARKKAKEIINEIISNPDLVSKIDVPSIVSLEEMLYEMILTRLVDKYKTKSIETITNKNSIKAINKIVNEIKKEFLDTVVEEQVEITPDLPNTEGTPNVDTTQTKDITDKIDNDAVIIAKNIKNIVDKSEKNTIFAEDRPTSIVGKIRNFKC